MSKKRILLASTLAILIAPTILGTMSAQSATTVQAKSMELNGYTLNNPIGTVTYGGAYTYDSNGNKSGNFLSGKSSWKLGKSILINGQKYYAVGANEYVSELNIDITDGMPVYNPVFIKDSNGATGTLKYAASVVDSHANATGLTLPANSAWKLGGMFSINDNLYYQVATDEYISSSAFNINESTTTTPSDVTPENTSIGLMIDTQIFDDNGNPTGKYLPAGSVWHTDQSKSMNNYTYYRVAPNQWVTRGNASSSTVFGNGPITITLSKATQLYDASTNTYTRTLPANSSWKAYSAVSNKNNQIFVKVSTNEWLPVDGTNLTAFNTFEQIATYGTTYQADFAVNYDTNKTIVANLTKDQSVYDTSSNSMTRTLSAGSSYKISQVVRNNKNEFWGKISNNEWLLIDANNMNMSYGDMDSIPSIAISEPDFATNIVK
ncbi:SLAP domain-containing protein [Companilactobacillus crustorum]|nr:SLAP domain-containing protein [Companilactobacillus crustorum]WDT66688.1 SLAP domain-containing protein [Companilactobacillus crustorum]